MFFGVIWSEVGLSQLLSNNYYWKWIGMVYSSLNIPLAESNTSADSELVREIYGDDVRGGGFDTCMLAIQFYLPIW